MNKKPSYFKQPHPRLTKADVLPKHSNDEMNETDLSLDCSGNFSQNAVKTPIRSEILAPTHNMTTPRNSTPISAVEQFRQLLSKSINVNGVDYIKISVIGSGSSKKSKVFKVMDSDNNFYALKVVKFENIRAKKDYMNEIEFLHNFPESERIIKLYNYEISDAKNEIYMIFELGDSDLRQFINDTVCLNHNVFQANYIKFIWQEMLSCVQELHSNNYIHGNLRPENFVFVKGCLKLIDFGIVKEIQEDHTHTEGFGVPLTRTSNEYRSPEILSLGSRSVKWRTSADVWSLGCILYELTYHCFPYNFSQKTGKYDYKSITFNVIQFPDFKNLKDVMTGCLETDQNRRYTIKDLLIHPFIMTCELSQLSTDDVKNNLLNLAKQVNEKYNDCDFGHEGGTAVRIQLARDLINGKRMVIKAKSR